MCDFSDECSCILLDDCVDYKSTIEYGGFAESKIVVADQSTTPALPETMGLRRSDGRNSSVTGEGIPSSLACGVCSSGGPPAPGIRTPDQPVGPSDKRTPFSVFARTLCPRRRELVGAANGCRSWSYRRPRLPQPLQFDAGRDTRVFRRSFFHKISSEVLAGAVALI